MLEVFGAGVVSSISSGEEWFSTCVQIHGCHFAVFVVQLQGAKIYNGMITAVMSDASSTVLGSYPGNLRDILEKFPNCNCAWRGEERLVYV